MQSSQPKPYFESVPTLKFSTRMSHCASRRCNRLALRLGDIERDRSFVAVHADEVGAFLCPRHIGRREAARVVAGAGPLDLDHIGAEIGQHLSACRAGQDAGQVEYAQTLQWSLGNWSRGKWSSALRANGFAHRSLQLAGQLAGPRCRVHIGRPLIGPSAGGAKPDGGMHDPRGDAGIAGFRHDAATRGQHREPRVMERRVPDAGHSVDLLPARHCWSWSG